MKKDCSTCKYEPDWVYVDGFYTAHHRYCGSCKWPKPDIFLKLPIVYSVEIKRVENYINGSGIKKNCKAWREKDNKTLNLT